MRADELVKNATQLLAMRYGRGDPIEEVDESVDQLASLLSLKQTELKTAKVPKDVLLMYSRLDLGSLYDSLAALSFMVALRWPAERVRSALDDIGHEREDALLDAVRLTFGRTNDGSPALRSRFPKIYDGLTELAAVPTQDRPPKLAAFVNGWYKKMRPVYWHDSHKGGEGAYFGYWCFEAALTAMLLDIDDSSLASHPHYPGDLVKHFRSKQ